MQTTYDFDAEEEHDTSIDMGTHDQMYNHRHIDVKYIPSEYRVKLWWFTNTKRAGIAEWEKV